MKKILLAALSAAVLMTTNAVAQELPRTQLKIVGGLSNLTAYKDFEQPFGPRRFLNYQKDV